MFPSFLDKLSSALRSMDIRMGNSVVNFPLDWLMLANGDAEPDDNIILFGFESKKREPILVAKVPRLPKNASMLQVEYNRLKDAWECLGSQAGFHLAQPLAMLYLDDQPVLVLSYVDGISFLRTSQKGFWQDSSQISSLFVDAAQVLREMNERTATSANAKDDAHTSFLPKINKFQELFSLSTQEIHALSELDDMLKNQHALVTHKVLLQGDFWHGNIVRGKHGKLLLLDWQYSRWCTDVSLDVYMFLLAAALSAVPRRSDRERAEDARKVLMRWRPDILPTYLSNYGKPVAYSLLDARHGMLLCCVEKAVRPVLDFGYIMDGSVWRALFSRLVDLHEESGFYDGI